MLLRFYERDGTYGTLKGYEPGSGSEDTKEVDQPRSKRRRRHVLAKVRVNQQLEWSGVETTETDACELDPAKNHLGGLT